MAELWDAIWMGIVEGLTEFLPVSSTGHLILLGQLLSFTGDRAKTFEVVVQFGAVLAVLVLYRQRFAALLRFRVGSEHGLNVFHIMLAMVPAGVTGVLLHGFIKHYLFSPSAVLIGLVAGGLLLIAADRRKTEITAEGLDDISYKQAFAVGLFQVLALWPGFSRSGSTISGGMLIGVSQKAAAEFTFLVSVPMMAGASGVDLIKSRAFLTMADMPLFLIGLLAAFIVGTIACVTFINLMKKLRISWFAYYRFVLAAVFAWLVL